VQRWRRSPGARRPSSERPESRPHAPRHTGRVGTFPDPGVRPTPPRGWSPAAPALAGLLFPDPDRPRPLPERTRRGPAPNSIAPWPAPRARPAVASAASASPSWSRRPAPPARGCPVRLRTPRSPPSCDDACGPPPRLDFAFGPRGHSRGGRSRTRRTNAHPGESQARRAAHLELQPALGPPQRLRRHVRPVPAALLLPPPGADQAGGAGPLRGQLSTRPLAHLRPPRPRLPRRPRRRRGPPPRRRRFLFARVLPQVAARHAALAGGAVLLLHAGQARRGDAHDTGAHGGLAQLPGLVLVRPRDRRPTRRPAARPPGLAVRRPGRRAAASAGLVFRVRGLRSRPATRLGGVRVCPTEDGVAHAERVTCERCSLCWQPLVGDSSRRVGLPLAQPEEGG
jgi:hypothetical protein